MRGLSGRRTSSSTDSLDREIDEIVLAAHPPPPVNAPAPEADADFNTPLTAGSARVQPITHTPAPVRSGRLVRVRRAVARFIQAARRTMGMQVSVAHPW